MTYPRRAQIRYTAQSWAAYGGGAIALAGVPVAVTSSLVACAGLLALGVGLLLAGRAYGRRAGRYLVGAESERLVAGLLRPLEERGWVVRHSVDWRGRGDIDHVVRAPSGLEFAIETKTSRYELGQLLRTREAAAYVAKRRRSCVPVICLARREGVSFVRQGVHVVSADLIAARLTQLAGLR